MTLPIPPLEWQQKSAELVQQLGEKIVREGVLSFADYMQAALYWPGLGYYSNGLKKFGMHGDFVTAPEISPLFAQCLAEAIMPALQQQVLPVILELGAGSGQLAVDLLLALEALNALPEHYFILELSAELSQRQRQKLTQQLPHLVSRVQWLTRLPSQLQAVVIANEVIDAMPVERFCYQQGRFWQYQVSCEKNRVRDSLTEPSAELQSALTELASKTAIANEGYQSEINLYLPAWLNSLANSLTAGQLWLFDYGFEREVYYHPQRTQGTLMCHYRHYAHTDPYFWPGLQDITAHVDFTAAAEAAIQAGFRIKWYDSQAKFLLKAGILTKAQNENGSVSKNYAVTQAVKRFLLPAEMGEAFKVLVLDR